MARNTLFALNVILSLLLGSAAGADHSPRFSPFGFLSGAGRTRDRGENALRVSMVEGIKSHQPSPNWHPRSLERLLVVPEHKIMLCYIDPSPLNAIMNDLNDLPSSELDDTFGSGAISHFGWSVEKTLAALHSPEWFKVVFFSDPLERLLAHYLAECTAGPALTERNASQTLGRNCLFFEDHVMGGMSPKFPQFVQTLVEGMSMEGNGAGQTPIYNTNFVPQASFCGGVNVSDYHYVGNLVEPLEPQVTHVLEKVGVRNEKLLRRHFNRSDDEPSLVQAAHHPGSASLPPWLGEWQGASKAAQHVISAPSWNEDDEAVVQGAEAISGRVKHVASTPSATFKAVQPSSPASLPKSDSGDAAISQAHLSGAFARPGPADIETAQFPLASVNNVAREEVKRPNPTMFKEHFKNVDTILAARNFYDVDYRTIQEVTGPPQPAKICLNTIFALNFEKRRILDWIAYHSLMGVDCFLLFHDNERSDVSDPEVRAVYDELAASPIVTMFQAKSLSDRGRIANTAEWFKFFPATYLLVIDVDEFVVIDTPAGQASDTPPNLFDFLENEVRVGEKDAVGVYLNRWDYGTGGYMTPPSVLKVPEFGQIFERWGAQDRVKPEKNLGKMILNLRVGFPIFLSVHEWNHKSGGPMLFPNGTEMCLRECGHTSKNPPLPITKQRISLNHYATGSLAECVDKAQLSKFSREDRGAECARLHPGTSEHAQLASTDGVAIDKSMVRYADATRKRRADLFPDADERLL